MNESWVRRALARANPRANLLRILQPVDEVLQAVNEMSRSVGYHPHQVSTPSESATHKQPFPDIS